MTTSQSTTRPPNDLFVPFCVGKKNWMFITSTKGATASAEAYSIAESAKANGLKPLESSQMLRRLAGSMTGKLYVTEEMFDRAKKTEGAGNLKNDCYMYLFHTTLLSDGVLDEMRNDRMTKQRFRSEEETMLTADWIRSFGAAMMIRSDGTMYWFLIASGDPAA